MEKFVEPKTSWQPFIGCHFSHALFSQSPGPQAAHLGKTFNNYYQDAAFKLITIQRS